MLGFVVSIGVVAGDALFHCDLDVVEVFNFALVIPFTASDVDFELDAFGVFSLTSTGVMKVYVEISSDVVSGEGCLEVEHFASDEALDFLPRKDWGGGGFEVGGGEVVHLASP